MTVSYETSILKINFWKSGIWYRYYYSVVWTRKLISCLSGSKSFWWKSNLLSKKMNVLSSLKRASQEEMLNNCCLLLYLLKRIRVVWITRCLYEVTPKSKLILTKSKKGSCFLQQQQKLEINQKQSLLFPSCSSLHVLHNLPVECFPRLLILVSEISLISYFLLQKVDSSFGIYCILFLLSCFVVNGVRLFKITLRRKISQWTILKPGFWSNFAGKLP